MENIENVENKTFPKESQAIKRTRCVSKLPKLIDGKSEEELRMSMPYCLCHGIDLTPTMLETKHCWEKGCPHLVFVKEVWAVSQKEGES